MTLLWDSTERTSFTTPTSHFANMGDVSNPNYHDLEVINDILWKYPNGDSTRDFNTYPLYNYAAPFALHSKINLTKPLGNSNPRNAILHTEDTKFTGPFGPDTSSLRIGKCSVINPLWQYNANADPRTAGYSGQNFGRIYNSRIRPNNPIVFIQPGQPYFYGLSNLLGLSLETESEIAKKLTKVDALQDQGKVEEVITNTLNMATILADVNFGGKIDNKAMKFYDFRPDFLRYKAYAISLCEELAIRMGVLDLYRGGVGQFGKTDVFTQFMDHHGLIAGGLAFTDDTDVTKYKSGFLPYRVEKTTEASDSFQNTIGEAAIASEIKSKSNQMKEILFAAGGGSTAGQSDGLASINGIADVLVSGIAGSVVSGVLSSQAGAVIKTGGNMMFPDIWKDSSYTKSLTINMKLHSPSGHPLPMYENIMFPIATLIPLVAPRMTDSSVYIGPPLVRMYSKGWFSVDMGMVESMTIRRGSGINDWTNMRLPRTVDVSLTIRELVNPLMLTVGGSAPLPIRIFFQRNTLLRDYLNTLAGVDIFASSRLSSRGLSALQALIYTVQKVLHPLNWLNNVYGLELVHNKIAPFIDSISGLFK
jgi:hypothetical protein